MSGDKMDSLDNLKRAAKKLFHEIDAAGGPQPTNAQVEAVIDAGCEAFAAVASLVKRIWREA
jgi:hypothetical protein